MMKQGLMGAEDRQQPDQVGCALGQKSDFRRCESLPGVRQGITCQLHIWSYHSGNQWRVDLKGARLKAGNQLSSVAVMQTRDTEIPII